MFGRSVIPFRTSREYRGVLKYLSWVQQIWGIHWVEYNGGRSTQWVQYNGGIVLIKIK
jgi:hypothetical protein